MPPAFARSAKQLGHVVQQVRQGRKLTQTELGRLAGQRQEMISKIETGHSGMKVATLFDVLAALDLEVTIVPRSKSSADEVGDIF
ncbi:helix-turn-helix domain-containing protein [Phenylobacterium sp. J367]|uniref:helix-turn-helix domain-containing protein n=1 Tax=Phenylobacterium sp. J367 TaxID=2898435 RepID=UPI0021508B20|nr:helix-turn-helix domain-containing protein [Phenylobacterium sp. J367]MCR5879665.1 XRE family transcriptional regulator [Phenylobacterium sp. J367]